MNDLKRLYKLKTIILSLSGSIIGIFLLVGAKLSEANSFWSNLPLAELGSTIFITSALVVVWEYLDGRDRERRDDERVRRLLKESAPDLSDAVVQSLAVRPDDLARVASPDLLDGIAKNVLALRLGDRDFAEQLYEDIRDQSIRAPERWEDVNVSIRLSPAGERNATGVPLFDVTIKWEYTVVPSHAVKRFACVSDRDDFYELTTDVPATSTWFMTPRAGLDPTSRDNYELLYFAVDGEERTIRRSERKAGQIYSVTVGDDVVTAGKPVRISHVYRVVTPRDGHRLYVEMPQPVKGLTLNLDYTDAGIARMSVTELVSSSRRPQVTRLPGKTNARVISLEMPGLLLAKNGFAFVWTLLSEQTAGLASGQSTARAKKRVPA